MEEFRTCKVCSVEKPLVEGFYSYIETRGLKEPAVYFSHTCKKCYSKKKMALYNGYKDTRPQHQEKRLSYLKRKHNEYRELVYDHYGRKCSCESCHETEPAFLTIDHIVPVGGEKERARLNHTDIYRFLVKNNFPPGFRVYCFNCNMSRNRTVDGECAHQSSSQTMAQASSRKCGEKPDPQMGKDIVGTDPKGSAVVMDLLCNKFAIALGRNVASIN